MFIDTHCHVDLFDDPVNVARAYEESHTRCVMTTLLPSHYQAAVPWLVRLGSVKAALGLHPLRAREGLREMSLFLTSTESTGYVGEIGLDFSRDGVGTKGVQIAALKSVLSNLSSGKFVTVHSRSAHEELAALLEEYRVGPVCFHYFIGGPEAAQALAARGHFFSINVRMLKSSHRNIIDAVPRDRILAETDGPFLTKKPLAALGQVYELLGQAWGTDGVKTEMILERNFESCRTNGRSAADVRDQSHVS